MPQLLSLKAKDAASSRLPRPPPRPPLAQWCVLHMGWQVRSEVPCSELALRTFGCNNYLGGCAEPRLGVGLVALPQPGGSLLLCTHDGAGKLSMDGLPLRPRSPPPPGTALRAISWLDHASTAPFTDPGNGEDSASRRQQCAWLAAAWDGGPATVWRVEGTADAAATSATGGGPHLVGAWNVDCVGEYWELGGPSTRGGGTICCLAWQPLKGALPIPCWVVWARPQGVGNLTGQTTRARRRGS